MSALGHLGSGSLDNLSHQLSKDPAAVHEQGADLLSSLLGGGTLSGIVNAVSRFASIAPGAAQKLLGYLTPLLLGTIASRFTGKPLNAQALTDMFAAEKTNIAHALPYGFSLADIPGLAAAGSTAVRSAAHGVEAASSSLPRWLLPVAGLAALGLLAWWFMSPTPAPAPDVQDRGVIRAQSPDTHRDLVPQGVKRVVPDVSKFSTELTETFSKLTEALASVKDAASAENALPKLQDLEGKLDVAKTTMKDLSDTGQTTVKKLVTSAEAELKKLVVKVLAIPGVGEKFKTIVDSIMSKLAGLAG